MCRPSTRAATTAVTAMTSGREVALAAGDFEVVFSELEVSSPESIHVVDGRLGGRRLRREQSTPPCHRVNDTPMYRVRLKPDATAVGPAASVGVRL